MIQDHNNVVSVEKSNKGTQQDVSKPNSRSVNVVAMEVRACQDWKGSRKTRKINPSCQSLCATIQDGDNIVSVNKSNKCAKKEVAKTNSRSVVNAAMEVRAHQHLNGSCKMKNKTRLVRFFAQQSRMVTTSFQLMNPTN